MKVRLVKKDNLMKAANRENLVKVAVQVNGRTGQYSSHRWKNPNAALNVLKETMKRAGIKTTDELEFKSKKTKKVVDEEQLIADYKESKTTDTLQYFVKKNYTVSKAKEKKLKDDSLEGNKKEIQNLVWENEELPDNLVKVLTAAPGSASKEIKKIHVAHGIDKRHELLFRSKENGKTIDVSHAYLHYLLNGKGKDIVDFMDKNFEVLDNGDKPEKHGQLRTIKQKDLDMHTLNAYAKMNGLKVGDQYRDGDFRDFVAEKEAEFNEEKSKLATFDTWDAHTRNEKFKKWLAEKADNEANQDLVKEKSSEADLQDYDVIFRNSSKRKRENQKEREQRLKDAIRVDSNGDYKKVSSYEQLRDNLSVLKGSNMEVIGRAAMDMVGIEAPLYVMKDRPFALDGSSTLGYCEYDWTDYEKGNNVREIGVSDYRRHHQLSFKTSIHESMHGVLGNLMRSDGNPVAVSLPHKNHEGIVEIIGQGTTKAVYGKEYEKQLPSYIRFVVDTALRLRGLDEFKGKSIHKIGEALGEKAVAKDTKYFEELSDYLNKNKRVGLRGKVLNELLKNEARLDSAGERGHKRSDYGPYEKSDMASLVEQLKAGLISMQAALNSSQYKKAAIVLLYSLLEEDEDVEATLSAFQ